MKIRTFQAGDEAHQVNIYNTAGASLPRFKPATVREVQQRARGRDFDAELRYFACEGDQPVAYCTGNSNGRVSYPWCLPGHEDCAGPLFQQVLEALRARGHKRVFAAYRPDWPSIHAFFEQQGFRHVRDMVNYLLEVVNMPTVPVKPSSRVATLRREDVPAIFELAPNLFRVATAAQLEEHLFNNPYFPPECGFVLHGRLGQGALAAGLFITEPTYADPSLLDAMMPCFRLGAFGTEGMQTKRIKGLFSFVARDDGNLTSLGLDLMGEAAARLQDCDDINHLAAQCPSDVPHLLRFYERNFRRQGAFPVFERQL